jgi:hypothetical protein
MLQVKQLFNLLFEIWWFNGSDRNPARFMAGKEDLSLINPDAAVNLIDLQDCINIILVQQMLGENFNTAAPYPLLRDNITLQRNDRTKSCPSIFTVTIPSEGRRSTAIS